MKNLEKFGVIELRPLESYSIEGGWLWFAIGYAGGAVWSGLGSAADWMSDNIELPSNY